MNKKRVLYVYTGNHPVHRALADSVCDSHVKLSWNIPKDFDIYLVEGAYFLPVFLRKIGKIKKSAKIIALFADPRLTYLKKKIYFDTRKKRIRKMSLVREKILLSALRSLDGAMCSAKMNTELFKELSKDRPVEKFYQFINGNVREELRKINPKLSSNNILFVGNGPDEYCKGLGMLIEAIKILQKKNSEISLIILGDNWKIKPEWNSKNINFMGKKPIIKFISWASILVHPGHGEGFGINVLEAMTAGVPAIVSHETGSKDLVQQLGDDFINEDSVDNLAKKIDKFLSLSIKEKKKFSTKVRIVAKEYQEKKKIKEFEINFKRLIERLNKS